MPNKKQFCETRNRGRANDCIFKIPQKTYRRNDFAEEVPPKFLNTLFIRVTSSDKKSLNQQNFFFRFKMSKFTSSNCDVCQYNFFFCLYKCEQSVCVCVSFICLHQ